MNTPEMEALVRSIIVERGLPFAILSVVASPVGWSIRVRAGTGGTVSFTIPAGRPMSMRMAIHEKLEDAY